MIFKRIFKRIKNSSISIVNSKRLEVFAGFALFCFIIVFVGSHYLSNYNELSKPHRYENIELPSYPPKSTPQGSSLRSLPLRDFNKIELVLKEENLLEGVKAWGGVILLVKFDSLNEALSFYHYNSIYSDVNKNGIQDEQDEGFFNPASTVKVGISAIVLEKLNLLDLNRKTDYRVAGTNKWYSFESDLEEALVISSNEATNRLILFLGFDYLNKTIQSKGLSQFSVNRLMLDKGTLTESPSFEIRNQDKTVVQPRLESSLEAGCFEIDEKIGNCASAENLAEILARIVQPHIFNDEENFKINEEDRAWLLETMGKTPRQLGFDQEDEFCRFLQSLNNLYPPGIKVLLSKCGVGLFSHSFVDTSFIETNEDEKYYTVVAISPPKDISRSQAATWMSELISLLLKHI